MNGFVRFVALLLGLYVSVGFYPESYAQYVPLNNPSHYTVYVDVDAKTWKTRGRIFYDVKGSIYRKLALAGFTIVRNVQDPHALTLAVRYIEEQGSAYGINKFGTIIKATFSLSTQSTDEPWKLDISEVSENSVSGTPPYLDVLEKFVTNPYYFFIGELLRQFVAEGLNIDQALLAHVQEVATQLTSSSNDSVFPDRFNNPDHAATSSNEFYLPFAMIRSIEELIRRNDPEAISVLSRLSQYPNERVRARALEALRTFEAL